ncbi:MAG: hypothetical protein KDB22_15110 [Planctomycetales bacterium]|nr:hypothetical protein [Planctomycetales bacterium]
MCDILNWSHGALILAVDAGVAQAADSVAWTLSSPVVRVVLMLTALFVLVFFAALVLKALRPATGTADTNDDGLVQNFEEMAREGDINESELRSIRSVLGASRTTQASD